VVLIIIELVEVPTHSVIGVKTIW